MYKSKRELRHYKFNKLSEIHYKNCIIKKKNNEIIYLKSIVHNLEKNNRELSVLHDSSTRSFEDLMDAYVTLQNKIANTSENETSSVENLCVNVPVTPQSNKIIGM